MSNTPSWMEEEERAEQVTSTGQTFNPKAPQLIRVHKEQSRKQKNFYIQESFAEKFEELVFQQKKVKGSKAPALAEEALLLLFEKYDLDINDL